MNGQWQKWIERLKSNDLTEAELLEFKASVESDPARRDAYLTELLAEVALETAALPDPFARRETGKIVSMKRRWPQVTAIAAAVAVLASLAYFAGKSGQSSPVQPPYFATITDADGTGDAGLRIGQPLGKEAIQLPDGAEIGIAMRGGARLKLRGPAELTIDGPDRVTLGKGRISTYAPPYARGFTVDTADGKMIDLGTRFVTAAGAGSGTEVHVMEGLVNARLAEESAVDHSLRSEHAAILQGGKIQPTDFLAQRLAVPLDPVLADRDGDGFPDAVEEFYETSPTDASSAPAALRIGESFAGYAPAEFREIPANHSGVKSEAAWAGAGTFQAAGLSYAKDGKSLQTANGGFLTTGESFVGAYFSLHPETLPPAGLTYVSFLMRSPGPASHGCFGGLVLYRGDQEELFVGKLSVADSYGSRLKLSNSHDAFDIPMDGETHLFVTRIDRTRLVTDVFIDPAPGQPETSANYRFRYQAVPDVDRLEVRSGCTTGTFPVEFDEIRVGLTWDAVVPAAR